jgi:hypothetical protein
MKTMTTTMTLVLLSVAFLGAALAQEGAYLNDAEVARIKSNQTLWTPSISDRFSASTYADLKALVSVLPPKRGGLRKAATDSMYNVISDEGVFAHNDNSANSARVL